MNSGTLYVIPSPIADDSNFKGYEVLEKILNDVDFFIVEDLRTARRHLKKLGYKKSLDTINHFLLNEHTQSSEIRPMIETILHGKSCALMSDAGMPGIADPGAALIRACHAESISVKPFSGPSSIILALSASGLNGQSFAFVGYLSRDKEKRKIELKLLEKLAEKQTQIFIETPYRNNQMLQDILTTCQPETELCIAVNITSPVEFIKTQTIQLWKKQIPDIGKSPAVFLIGRK